MAMISNKIRDMLVDFTHVQQTSGGRLASFLRRPTNSLACEDLRRPAYHLFAPIDHPLAGEYLGGLTGLLLLPADHPLAVLGQKLYSRS